MFVHDIASYIVMTWKYLYHGFPIVRSQGKNSTDPNISADLQVHIIQAKAKLAYMVYYYYFYNVLKLWQNSHFQ